MVGPFLMQEQNHLVEAGRRVYQIHSRPDQVGGWVDLYK